MEEDFEDVCNDGCKWVFAHSNWWKCSICGDIKAILTKTN